MGLGLLGRGVGDARYVAECGAELIITDLKTEQALTESLQALKEFTNITYRLGEHNESDFIGRDLIIKAAGVPRDSVYIEAARKEGTPVRMSADLFMEYAGIQTIGVTGTRGKSTTTHMIAAILKEAGKKVLLGGNVRGVSTLSLLPQVTGDEIAVLELDSWQCQGLKEAKRSPAIAVFTTFFDDHLNYYQGDRDAYLADKANIFLNQSGVDTLVLGSQCAEMLEERYRGQINAHIIVVGAQDFRADWKLRIPGEHNRYAAALATEATRALGVLDEPIEKALAEFRGVPGRLELVREMKGISVYNDTTATTPDATLAALRALDTGKKSIVLIMGGADKGLLMDELLKELPKRTKKVVLLSGSGTDRVLGSIPGAPLYGNLEEAVKAAITVADAGDSVVLSPAFASFGMFKNEYDRGDQFVSIIQSL